MTSEQLTRTTSGLSGPRGHVVVIGGGIAGLAAAYKVARDGGQDVSVTLLEASGGLGGKVRVSSLAGVPVDEGAEAVQATRPEATGLARSVGLEAELESPAASGAGLWVRGRIRPIPPSVRGGPTDLQALAASGLLSPLP